MDNYFWNYFGWTILRSSSSIEGTSLCSTQIEWLLLNEILSIYLKDESFVLTQVTLDAGFPIIPAVINGLNFNGIYHLPSVDCIILVCGHLFRFINFYWSLIFVNAIGYDICAFVQLSVSELIYMQWFKLILTFLLTYLFRPTFPFSVVFPFLIISCAHIFLFSLKLFSRCQSMASCIPAFRVYI